MTTVRYYKKYKDMDAKAFEITKAEARQTLDGYWDKDSLDHIFNDEVGFRLYTPYAEVWSTHTDADGRTRIAMAGFYGICE